MQDIDIQQLKDISSQVRRDIIRMTYLASSGHPGGSLGCVELLVALYFKVMKHNPNNFSMKGENEDIFFLSNGHISPAWYSVLARSGYFPVKELTTFRKINSRLQGHPATEESLPGVRIASGSLGQGLSVAIGAAIGKKLNNDNRIIYCLMGDGEQEEGQVWEAVMFAGAKKIDNLIAIIDNNGKQIDGNVKDVLPFGDLSIKYKAFGWEVLEIKDGNNIEEVLERLYEAKNKLNKKKPVCIIMNTIMGKGVDFMENDYKWHGIAPNKEQMENALAQIKETIGDF